MARPLAGIILRIIGSKKNNLKIMGTNFGGLHHNDAILHHGYNHIIGRDNYRNNVTVTFRSPCVSGSPTVIVLLALKESRIHSMAKNQC